MEYDHFSKTLQVQTYAKPENQTFTAAGVRRAYLSKAAQYSDLEDTTRNTIASYYHAEELRKWRKEESEPVANYVQSKKKYKPVGVKVRPVYADLDDQFRITRNITGDPLEGMPDLSPNPPPFIPTGRYTQERKEAMDEVHKGDFLTSAERAVMHELIAKQNEAFAWDDSERGKFREDFFPPVPIPTVEHKPWVHRPIKIPPSLRDEMCALIEKKRAAGVYEPSNSSYRSPWFCVLKKNGTLRIVHSLEPLNAVTIAHSGIPPATEELAAHFSGRACGGIMDLYVGYDERALDPKYRDLTTFQTPFGAMRLCTLPMGWTNSVPIFHDDVTEILRPEIPEYTIPYLDDVGARGPATRYEDENGDYERIPENPNIRRFIWEHLINVNRLLQRMKYCGGTFSGYKSTICAAEIVVVGHLCTYEGRKPTEDKIGAVMRWEICNNLSDVRAFLGIAGVLRSYIPNYAIRAEGLQKLTRGKVPFVWGPEQIKSVEMVKEGVRLAQPLRPIDYHGQGSVVLAVDSSYIGIGFYIYQEDKDDPKKLYYVKFGSMTMNEREARFSQPKRELYGLMRALKANKAMLFGVRKLIVETDAKYIHGMLRNPDLMPNATINRWIDEILMFHFTIRHKAGATFGPDGLSRRPRQPTDPEEAPISDDEDDDPVGPPEMVLADSEIESPFPVESFVDQIDSRGGYFLGIANSYMDISVELMEADLEREKEKTKVEDTLKNKELHCEHKTLLQQLLNVLALPEESEEETDEAYYPEGHRKAGAITQDLIIPHVIQYLENHRYKPSKMDDKQYKRFINLANRFILYDGRLYRRGYQSQHRLYIEKNKRMYMLKAAHDHNGHRGFYATKTMLIQRFWWPEMEVDIAWFIKSCEPCQKRQLQLLKIPPKLTDSPALFEVLHADVVHMTPASNGCKYIVHGRCAASSWAEGRALKKESAKAIGLWMYEDILCRWGTLRKIVTDNGTPFIAAVKWLKEKYGIAQIRISPYNSQANGKIERPHFDIRQMLAKCCGEQNLSKWYWFLHAVFWADRVSVRKRFGCSPYYFATGTHPVLPIDVKEATWLVKPPTGVLTDEELIASRARALAKHRVHIRQLMRRIDEDKLKQLERYEKDNAAVIKDYKFEPGDLVLVRNTIIEGSLDRKMKPRYLGPMIVISRRPGGAYVVAEMNGAVLKTRIGAFRVVPYFARTKIDIPEGVLNLTGLREDELDQIDSLAEDEVLLENSQVESSRDYLMDGVNLDDSDEEISE